MEKPDSFDKKPSDEEILIVPEAEKSGAAD